MCAGRDQTDFAHFQAARERFFETLRRDSELRRLEAAWRLAPLPPPEPERISGEAADPANSFRSFSADSPEDQPGHDPGGRR